MLIITVTQMLNVPTLLVASTVPVTGDILEVGSHVGVSGGKMQMNGLYVIEARKIDSFS